MFETSSDLFREASAIFENLFANFRKFPENVCARLWCLRTTAGVKWSEIFGKSSKSTGNQMVASDNRK